MTSQLTSSNSPNALSQPLLLLFSHYVMTPGPPQHARPPCPSPPPRAWLQFVSIELVMPSSHLVLCCPLSLFPSIFPSIRVFSSEVALCIRWPKYCSFSFSISHEIKRCLLLGRKPMTNLDSVLKSRDITLLTKVHLVKAMLFQVMYGCESWPIMKAEH